MSKRRENGYNVLQNKLTNTTINGVTFTINEDKSVTLNGTATNSIITNLITGKYDDNNATNPLIIPENITNYRLSGCPSGGSGSTYKLDIYNKDNILIGTDLGEGIDISKNSGDISELARVRIIVYAGAVLNNVTFYPMITYGTEEKPYQEYGASPSPDYPSEVRAVGDNVNILPNEAVSESKLGVSLTVNSNGSLYLKGTATDNATFQLKGNFNSSVEVFRFKANTIYKNVSNINIKYRKINNGDYVSISPGQIFSYSSDVVVQYLYIEILKGTTVDKIYYPKIVEYHEGIDESYSPYGQGSVEIKKSNNLSNFTTLANGQSSGTYNGLTFEMLNKFSCKISGKPTSNELRFGNPYNSTQILVPFKEGIEYKFKTSLNSGGEMTLVNSKENTYRAVFVQNKQTIPVEEGDDGISSVKVYTDVNKTYNEEIVTCVIYDSSQNDDFIPQEDVSHVLSIQKPMLSGDYFDLERVKEVHHFNKYISTLEDTWVLTSDEKNRFRLDGNIVDSLNTKKQYCSHSSKYEVWATQDKTFSVKSNTNKTSSIYFNSSQFHTAEEFNQFVAEQEEAGTPLTFWYEAEEYELDLTEEQITVLNELQNIILYDDTTNIILPDVYPILDYDVSKIIDTTTTFEASLDSNGYFVVPDYDIKCLISYSESDIPSMPEAVETSVSIPGRDGDIPLNTIYSPLSFTIVCYTEDNLTPEEKYTEETKMNKFLNSIKNNTIKLKLESKGKYYDVKYNGQLTTTNYPKHLQFSIPLKSSSSYAKDIDESYILGNGEKESNTIKEVGAVFVIEGPAQTPKIYLNDYEMFYDNVLLSNTKLVIDSNKSTVTMINREGTETNAMRYYNHEFPKIQNGNNILKVSSGIDEDRQVSVRWSDLKL